jgi:hypothetical protein
MGEGEAGGQKVGAVKLLPHLCIRVHLRVVHHAHHADLLVHRARVAHRLHYVARARLAFCAQHGGALRNAAKRLAQVAAAAHKGHRELVLVDVVLLVRHGEHLGLVNVVHLQRLQHLRLHKVPNARLCHNGQRHLPLDAQDHVRVRRARHAARMADVRGHALQRHHRHRARVLRNACLRRINHVLQRVKGGGGGCLGEAGRSTRRSKEGTRTRNAP